MASITYSVTVASGNLYGGGTGSAFYINGVRNASGPGTFNWNADTVLRFDQSNSSNDNHPLIFSTTTATGGIISSGVTYYLDGASNQANYINPTTFNAASERYIEIDLSAQANFYYLCYIHGIGMGGRMLRNADQTYTVTVASGTLYVSGGSGSVYYLDGARNMDVKWVKGATLRFNQDAGSNDNHPLLFTTSTSDPGGNIISSNVTYYLDGISDQSTYTNTSNFNSATERYIEITPESETDFNFYCYVHGIGMGGAIDITQDTWGANVWGANSWASLVNTATPSGESITSSLGTPDVFNNQGWGRLGWNENSWGVEGSWNYVDVTGNAITSSIGNEEAVGVIAVGWGRQTWGAQAYGIGGQSVITGMVMNTEVASVSITNEINIGWGGLTYGAGNWGDLGNPNVFPTGVALTATLGNEANVADANVSVTGIGRSVTLAGAVGGTSVDLTLTGNSVSVAQTGVFAGELVLVEVTSPSNDEWGTEFWGAGLWGVGDGITVLLGTDSVHIGDANVQVTGVQAASNVGAEPIIPVVIDSGVAMTSAIGSAFAGPLVVVEVTTASATAWGDAPFGEGQWGQGAGTDIGIGGEEVAVPSVEVNVTGISVSLAIGTEAVTGHANVSVTGIASSITLGNEDAFTNVRANPTGMSVGTIVIGDFLAGISDTPTPTGVTMTSTTGTIGLNAWELVEPGSAPTWTVVDKAA